MLNFKTVLAAAIVVLTAVAINPSLDAQSGGIVKVTPLGSHPGELCGRDRALIFEDPSGVRILYDPGNSTDETDARLGDIHAVMVSHGHGDHLGAQRINRSAPGSCAAPAVTGANANSNFATIAVAKNAIAIVPDIQIADWVTDKFLTIRGSAVGACPIGGLDNITDVPASSVCVADLRAGGTRSLRRGGQAATVRITTVMAAHGSNIPAALISAPGLPAGISAPGGAAAGFIVRFTNGLTAYLTGDTAAFGDMHEVIGNFYKPNLIVANIGDITAMGPDEALYMIRTLVRPTTVVVSHVNEAATAGGVVIAGTKTDAFASGARSIVDVVLPLSGTLLNFDGNGRCVGCAKQ